MSPSVPSAYFKREFQPFERIRSHGLNFVGGMMPRGSIRKGCTREIQDGNGAIWKARCVQWSGAGAPIWEICDSNTLPKSFT